MLAGALLVFHPDKAVRHAVPLCGASELLPSIFLAPPEPPEDGVSCTVSHLEIISLHKAFFAQKPSSGSVRLDLDGESSSDEILTVDLGLREPCSVELTPDLLKLRLSDDAIACLPWKLVAKVAKKKRAGVWELYDEAHEEEEPYRVEGISDVTNRPATLLPHDGRFSPPTAVLGGFNMHRTKNIDPGEDTKRKLAALGKARGRVLDVCTGLGYTSIAAAERALVEEVATIELDPLMVYLQRANPYSRALFEDAKIRRLLGDATEVLPALPESYFDYCIHDPPANAMSGELYSLEFYQQLRRVLRNGGVLFHYIGDPSSKASGKLFRGVLERLREAGFEAKTAAEAYGITATARHGNPRR